MWWWWKYKTTTNIVTSERKTKTCEVKNEHTENVHLNFNVKMVLIWKKNNNNIETNPDFGIRQKKKMGNSMPTTYDPNHALNRSRTSTLGGRSAKSKKSESTRPENSRVLFLLYLIHRTWNVMVETVDLKSKR